MADGVFNLPEAGPELPAAEPALRALKEQVAALGALTRAGHQPSAVARALAKLDKAEAVDMGALRQGVSAWLDHERLHRGQRLSAQLREQCAQLSLPLVVLTRAPLELRLPPVGVRVDLDANTAEITFGQVVIERCDARAADILAARASALRQLEAGTWDAAGFHAQLRQAYARLGGQGWVELGLVLPELTLIRQPLRFRVDPSAQNFEPYPRARFAYDLWRLRRDRALLVDGWRLSVAPATGSSTANKKRVFWLEDDQGRGQYHLTLRFVREDAPDAG